MDQQTVVALAGVAVGAIGVVTPAVAGAWTSKAQRRAEHRAWLRDERLDAYVQMLSLVGAQLALPGSATDPADHPALGRTILLGSADVQRELRRALDTRATEEERVHAHIALSDAMSADLRTPR